MSNQFDRYYFIKDKNNKTVFDKSKITDFINCKTEGLLTIVKMVNRMQSCLQLMQGTLDAMELIQMYSEFIRATSNSYDSFQIISGVTIAPSGQLTIIRNTFSQISILESLDILERTLRSLLPALEDEKIDIDNIKLT